MSEIINALFSNLGEAVTAPGRRLGESFADSIGEEKLLEGLRRAQKTKQGTADKFGENAGRTSGLGVLAGLMAQASADKNQDNPGILSSLGQFAGDSALALGEVGNQTVMANQEENLYHPVVQAALGGGAEFLLPRNTSGLALEALSAVPGFKGAQSIRKRTQTPSFFSPEKAVGANKLLKKASSGKKAVSEDAILQASQRGVAGKSKILKDAGVDTRNLSGEDINRMFDRHIRSSAQGGRVARGATTNNAKVGSKGSQKATEQATKTSSAGRLGKLKKPLGLAGLGFGAFEFGRRTGSNNTAEELASVADPDEIAARRGNNPEQSGAGQPSTERLLQVMQQRNQQQQAASEAEKEKLQLLIDAFQPEERNMLQKIGDTLTNMANASRGQDPRLVEQQLQQPSPKQQVMQQLILNEFGAGNQMSPLEQAKLKQILLESEMTQEQLDAFRQSTR